MDNTKILLIVIVIVILFLYTICKPKPKTIINNEPNIINIQLSNLSGFGFIKINPGNKEIFTRQFTDNTRLYIKGILLKDDTAYEVFKSEYVFNDNDNNKKLEIEVKNDYDVPIYVWIRNYPMPEYFINYVPNYIYSDLSKVIKPEFIKK